MGITPDRNPGPLIEDDEIRLIANAVEPTQAGALNYNPDGTFRMRDSAGTFNPRTGGTGLDKATHDALRSLIHFINDGPAEGFASGSFRETTGTVFPSAIIWYVVGSTPPAGKIVEKLITYTGAFPTTIVWKMYDTDGSTVLITITDTITYSGPFETGRTRTAVV